MKGQENLMEWSGFLSEQINKKHPPLVRDAVLLIESEYAYLYGIDTLADRLEVSKHHLIRLFSAHTGISPGKYLSLVRLFHAMRLLRSGKDTPLEIIAGACGYSCANYFAKVFKKQTGTTPSEFAKEFRMDSEDFDANPLLRKLYL